MAAAPVDELPDGLQPGLHVNYYEGEWKQLPSFDELEVVANGVTPCCDLRFARRDMHYALLFTGWLCIPETGVYAFTVASDDGTRLTIAGEQVVLNDNIHGERARSGALALAAGMHPLRLEYFQAHGGKALELRVARPGLAGEPLPDTWLFHTP